MLQVETLVSACAGGSTDRKIACETQADDLKTDPPPESSRHHPDSPPESFWLSRDEENEWLDRNFIYERKESTKGNSSSTNLNPNSNSNSNSTSNSQRFANLKSKTSMIGLPKPQKPSFDAKNLRNHKPSNIKLFPKRSASVGKSFVEPSSPKVSCMGKVRSKRGKTSTVTAAAKAAVKEKTARTERKQSKHSFFKSFRAIFRSGGRNKHDRRNDSSALDSSSITKNTNSVSDSKARDSTASLNDVSFVESVTRNSVSEGEPPGLGVMMRFTSGRRSESWVDDSEIHVSR